MNHFRVPSRWRYERRQHPTERDIASCRQGPGAVRDPVHAPKHLVREPGDPTFGPGGWRLGPQREPEKGIPEMNERGKSDSPIVPRKPSNKDDATAVACGGGGGKGADQGELGQAKQVPGADPARPATCARPGTAGSGSEIEGSSSRRSGTTSTTSIASGRPTSASSGKPHREWIGVTWQEYGEKLEETSRTCPVRLKRGAYRAKPVKRSYIPKADGRQRPLGVTALEDKIVQRATVEVLNAVYETDFLGFSYGFRPGAQPAHGAGCARRWDSEAKGELGARCRHSWFLSTPSTTTG